MKPWGTESLVREEKQFEDPGNFAPGGNKDDPGKQSEKEQKDNQESVPCQEPYEK